MTVEPCQHEPRLGVTRRGPSLGRPSYELAVNGEHQLRAAVIDVLTWPDRIEQRARILTAAVQP